MIDRHLFLGDYEPTGSRGYHGASIYERVREKFAGYPQVWPRTPFDRILPGGILILDDYEWAGTYRVSLPEAG